MPRSSRVAVAPTASDRASIHAALLRRAPGLLWATDVSLRCTVASGRAAERFDLAAGVAIADSLLNGDGAGLAAHRSALDGHAAHYAVRHGDTLLHCHVEPCFDAAGTVVGVVGDAQADAADDESAAILTTQHNIFRTMLDQSLVGIGICDALGRYLFVNAALARFAEIEPMQQRQLSDASRVWGAWGADGDQVPLDDWPMARALRGETTAGREMYRLRADGQRDHLLIAAAPVRDTAGALIGAVVTVSDITERKRMEETTRALNDALEQRVRERTAALERTQQTLVDLLDHSTAVIYLKNRDGRYLRINRHFERLFDVTNEQMTNRGDVEIFPPEIARQLRANDRRVFAGESLHIEEVVPTGGEERTYLSVKFPLRDQRGDVYGLCGISTDITERKQMEAAVRRSQATLTAVIESSLDPIWAIDAQMNLLTFNTAASRFISEVIGTAPTHEGKLRHLVPSDVLQRWQRYLERAMAGERFTVEEALVIRDVPRRMLVSLTPMFEDHRVTGVAAFTKDITELMQAGSRRANTRPSWPTSCACTPWASWPRAWRTRSTNRSAPSPITRKASAAASTRAASKRATCATASRRSPPRRCGRARSPGASASCCARKRCSRWRSTSTPSSARRSASPRPLRAKPPCGSSRASPNACRWSSATRSSSSRWC
jgi:PAS domain S-box-containing protein